MSAVNIIWANKNPTINNYKDSDYAKRLSRDKPFVYKNGGYIIYANGTQWFFRNFVTWELYWTPQGFENWPKVNQLEFHSTWFSHRHMFLSIKKIIYKHPNLKRTPFFKKLWLIYFT